MPLTFSVLLLGCDLAPPEAPPPPPLALEERLATYPVYGSTGAEVRAWIEQNAPVPPPSRTGGVTAHGYNQNRIRWSHQPAEGPEGCRAEDVRVSLTSVIIVPEWQIPEGTPAALRASWAAYDAALRAHEQRHKDIAVQGAEAARAALIALPPQPDCEALAAEVDRVAREIWAETDARQAAFDEETEHGAAAGVSFP